MNYAPPWLVRVVYEERTRHATQRHSRLWARPSPSTQDGRVTRRQRGVDCAQHHVEAVRG